MINFLISYWYVILVAIAGGVVGCAAVYRFAILPTSAQMTKVKEWLLYAVVEAEKELGSGTGQIKLRFVYDKFVTKFPQLAKVISFDTFSTFVDEALEKFKTMLESNEKLAEYVEETKEE
jgi:hypothetical protein